MKMTFKVTVIGGVIVFFAVVLAAVFIPTLVWNPPQTVIAHPYSSLRRKRSPRFFTRTAVITAIPSMCANRILPWDPFRKAVTTPSIIR